MTHRTLRRTMLATGTALALVLSAHAAVAQDEAPTVQQLQAIKDALDAQKAELDAQKRQLDQQAAELKRQQQQLEILLLRAGQRVSPSDPPDPAPRQPIQTVQVDAERMSPEPVGQAPETDERTQDIAVISDVGGVLARKGTLIVDPMVEYSHSSDNRFFFQGVQIVDAVLIGIIEATDTSRDVITPSIGLRYGITNFLEADVRVPFQYRQDRFTFTPVGSGSVRLRDISSSGLGDIEMGLHYQINKRRRSLPYAVANLRVKSDTGKGPFEVARDSSGVETELPTGSGFWSVEPSVTLIYPSDPAVLFANFGYLYNIPEDVNRSLSPTTMIGRVEPGNAFKFSAGAGISLNEKLSMSFGYEHSFVQGTKTEVGTLDPDTDTFEFVTVKSRTAQVGSLLWGASYVLNDHVSILFNVGVGATDDAPDVRVMLRVPIRFQVHD